MKKFPILFLLFSILIISGCEDELNLDRLDSSGDIAVEERQRYWSQFHEITPCEATNITYFIDPSCIGTVYEDAVNEAVIETMNFPDDDRYQVINQLSNDCLQYQGRVDDRIMMHLVMRSGRSNKSKQAFYSKVVEYLGDRVQIKPENVFITITENHDVDFSFKNGLAQFVV